MLRKARRSLKFKRKANSPGDIEKGIYIFTQFREQEIGKNKKDCLP